MRSKATAVMVNYRKLVNVEDFEQWTWGELVSAAIKATDMRHRIEETIKTTYGDYIARLTMASAVKRGGIKEFCEEAGLNYGTVKNWRSQYLTAEQKREYKLKEPEPEPEPETIVIIDDNSADESEPEFEDMFDGSTRKASELVEDEQEIPIIESAADVLKEQENPISAKMQNRSLLRSRIESAIDNHTGEEIETVIVYFKRGGMLVVGANGE